MKLNRRSLLALIPGAALGAKPVAAAFAAEAEKLALAGLQAGMQAIPDVATNTPRRGSVVALGDTDWARRRLAEFIRPAERARRWEQTFVTRIDPDLASMRSLSLSAKMAIQKQRDFDRHEKSQIGYWEDVIAGVFD